jgi:hypothetical protein
MVVKVCDKCLKRRKCASFRSHWGNLYKFCKDCTKDLENYESTIIPEFIRETQVSKNMREARRLRAVGESPWNKKASS